MPEKTSPGTEVHINEERAAKITTRRPGLIILAVVVALGLFFVLIAWLFGSKPQTAEAADPGITQVNTAQATNVVVTTPIAGASTVATNAGGNVTIQPGDAGATVSSTGIISSGTVVVDGPTPTFTPTFTPSPAWTPTHIPPTPTYTPTPVSISTLQVWSWDLQDPAEWNNWTAWLDYQVVVHNDSSIPTPLSFVLRAYPGAASVFFDSPWGTDGNCVWDSTMIYGSQATCNPSYTIAPYGDLSFSMHVRTPNLGTHFMQIELIDQDAASWNNSAYVSTEVESRQSVDLSVHMAVEAPAELHVGDRITVTIDAANFGSTPAQNVNLMFQVDGCVWVDGQTDGCWSGNSYGDAVLWPGESIQEIYYLTMPGIGSVNLWTSIYGDQYDYNPYNNGTSWHGDVVPFVADVYAKQGPFPVPPVYMGSTYTFEFEIGNAGNRDASNVDVKIQMPEDFQVTGLEVFFDNGAPSQPAEAASVSPIIHLNVVPAGATARIRVTAVPLAPGMFKIGTWVSSDSDVDLTNNYWLFTGEVTAQFQLYLPTITQ